MRRLAAAIGLAALVSLPGLGCAAKQTPRATEDALLPARVRRLSNFEFERSANALLSLDESLHDALPPDERQDGYTINERQAMPSHYAVELARVADKLAGLAVEKSLAQLLPCANESNVSDACVEGALTKLGRRAFRRAPTEAERRSLLALYQQGFAAPELPSDAARRASGMAFVLATLLKSPSFLYLTELGDAQRPNQLTPYEIASSLAYAVSGTAPNADLLSAAESPTQLLEAEQREAFARRLLAQSSTRHHFREFVLEWLEVDQLERTAKASHLVANYDVLKSHMLAETRNFADEVMVYGGASLRSLLGAGFTSLDPEMADYYGIPGFSGARVRLSGQRRLGVLEHASFLSAHAYEDVTSPVKRGDFVLRRVLCVDLPRPGEVGIETVMPPRSEHGTTRERFAAHVASAECRTCHASIDPLGFSFESFDAAGRRRSREHEAPIETAGQLDVAGHALRFRDSAELATQLSQLPETRRCFARQALRYWTGRRSAATEEWFESLIDTLPSARRDSLLEWVVAWVKSPEFIQRRRPT
ncbi:MAG: DUF1588 domain-containing protein [Polyangiaceae bacterium]